LEAHVSWVGTSSIEVTESVLQNDEPILNAKLLMVARHSRENKAVPVNPLIVDTDEEKAEFAAGESLKQLRIARTKSSLLHSPPDADESKLAHDIFRNSVNVQQKTFKRLTKMDNEVWMEDANLKTSIMCFPEHRNLHNKIFGGYVMRKALEHSWSNALIVSGAKIVPVCIDDISFLNPVSIGDLFFMSSTVTYTEDNLMLVRCHAEVRNSSRATRETTNEFYFLFAAVDEETRKPIAVKKVRPKSYAEYMLYLDGRRRFANIKPNIISSRIFNAKL